MTPQTMSEKDTLLRTWEREHECTLRVLREVPPGKEDFQPAARSQTLSRLVWTFIREEKVMEMVANGTLDLSQAGKQPEPPPMTIRELIDVYEQAHRQASARIQAMSDDDFNETTKFFAGPKKIDDVRVGQVLWNFIMDKVHHRGQLSVYLRMLDARVPSIYGPSADEPWT